MEKRYFSHDHNARNDRKIKALVKDFNSAGYGIFWGTVEMIHEDGGRLEMDYLTYAAIANDLNEDFELVKTVIENCVSKYKLFTINEQKLHSERAKRNIESIQGVKDQRSKAGRASAEKRRQNTPTVVQHPLNNRSTPVEQPFNDSSTPVQQNPTGVQQINKEINKEINNTVPKKLDTATTVGSEKVANAANEAWMDKFWIENTCKAHQLNEPELKQWMYQYNASISNDPINGFNAAKYKKIFGGWLQSQFNKGYKLAPKKGTGKEQLKTLK